MIARIYVQSVINALIDYKDLINISELEKLSIMPNNSIRKVLTGSRQLTALEAAKIASVLNSVLFRFSGLDITENEVKQLL